jgi:hypothetical protein
MEKNTKPASRCGIGKTNQYLSLGHYSPLTIRNYLSELRFLFVYSFPYTEG